MSSENGPDATYASVQEEIIGFARCPTLSTIVAPPPLFTIHLLVHRVIAEERSRRTAREDVKVRGNWGS